MKLYELTENKITIDNKTLTQIRAACDFEYINKGDLGGWIECESSLSDNVWIHQKAKVFRKAKIYGGVIYGGEIHGGIIYDGEIKKHNHIGFANVGSDNGYLLAYVNNKKIVMSRGCFHGTIEEFYHAVEKKHGDNEHGLLYKSLRPIIENKLNKFC